MYTERLGKKRSCLFALTMLGLTVLATWSIILSAATAQIMETTTITVNTFDDELNDGGGDCSLREAIQAANTDSQIDGCLAGSDHDTIVLPSGSYTLTLDGANEDDNATGDLDIVSDLTISGAGAESTLVDGNQLDRVLHIHGGATVEIIGVTITQGRSPLVEELGGDGVDGGGVYNDGALTLVNSIVISNTTSAGGFNSDGNAGHGGNGGGIYSSGALTLSNSIVANNVTGDGGDILGADISGDGGSGGGVYSAGTLEIINCMLNGNTTGQGGRPVFDYGINGSGGDGGGIFSQGALTLTSSAVFSNVTGDSGDLSETGGRGGHGGGIASSGILVVLNATISGNTTGDGFPLSGFGPDGCGGGIYSSGPLTLTNSTVANNHTGVASHDFLDDGGGIYQCIDVAYLRNTIVAGNSDHGGQSPDCRGTFISQDYNLIGDSTGCILTPQANDQIGAASDPIDPHLGPLQENGGPTPTHALATGGPAIDAGYCGDATTDQRGFPRPIDILGATNVADGCDIGAYEVQLQKVYLPIVQR
jgi:CSLREA domain-containing protein